MKTKTPTHTPGAWKWITVGQTIAIDAPQRVGLAFLPLEHTTAGIPDEDRANANLIIASPDLLTALKDLCRNVEELSGFWNESTSNFMQQADAAIQKAEGR